MAARQDAAKGFNNNAEGRAVAERLPDLELEARNLASLIMGLRNRTKAGHGTDYHTHDMFQNGMHDPRKIDYRASGRRSDGQGNDLLLIREREMQVTQNFYLWLDRSGTMDFEAPRDFYPDQPRFNKKNAAAILLLATAHLAVMSGEQFTLLGSPLKLSGNKAGVERAVLELEHGRSQREHDLPKLPIHRGRPLGQNSHVVIFSDFLCPLEEIEQTIRSLLAAGVKGHLVQVLDPAEIEWRYEGHLKFMGMEGPAAHLLKKAETGKEEYERLIANHIRGVENMVKRLRGWTFSTYVTDQPLYEGLLPLFGIRPQRKAPAAGPKP